MIMSSLLKKLNTAKVVVPNAFMYPHTLGYNDHFIYFVLICFTVAQFCVMIIFYFSFLNVNVGMFEWKYFILPSIFSL